MKTAYYTFTTWDSGAMAAGFDHAAGTRQAVLLRQPEGPARAVGGDNVIDLAAWRAANPELSMPEERPAEEWGYDGCEEFVEPELSLPAPRTRRDHHRSLFAAELISTLGVLAVSAALLLRVLLF